MGAFEERLDPSRFGIFQDSEALGAQDEVEVQMKPGYLEKTRNCEVCGREISCQISWAELYCIQHSIMPQQVGQMIRRPDLFSTSWRYDNRFKCIHPGYRCNCSHIRPEVIFDMSPTEAHRHLEQASKNGIINDDQQQLIRAVSGAVAHMRSRQAYPQQPQRRG